MMNPMPDGRLNGRRLEFFHHESQPEWGYDKPQTDTFAVMHPKEEIPGRQYPLYVVVHSAGHDVYSALSCLWKEHNHDIYHVPEDMYGLFLDCRANACDWWWGGDSINGQEKPENRGCEKRPVEKRCIATVEWTMDAYPIDKNRVYAVGNSMGGSGALGMAVCRGDIFAAVKVNVPAGVRHVMDRCCLDSPAPAGFTLPDPPVIIDYSGTDDIWSTGHEQLYRAAQRAGYPLIGFWGPYGHCNDDSIMEQYNDLIHSLGIGTLRKDEAYPVFMNASTDDPIPWPDHRDSKDSGQVNAFFRWKVLEDTRECLRMELRLMNSADWNTRRTLPEETTADVMIRRLQRFSPENGAKPRATYGGTEVTAELDENGHPMFRKLPVLQIPQVLEIRIG